MFDIMIQLSPFEMVLDGMFNTDSNYQNVSPRQEIETEIMP